MNCMMESLEFEDFTIEHFPHYVRVTIEGTRLDALIAPKLKSELVVLSGSGAKNIVLDMRKVRYCDSSGLSAILVANRLCRSARGVLVLLGVSEDVQRLLTISQLQSVLNIAENDEQVEHFIPVELPKRG